MGRPRTALLAVAALAAAAVTVVVATGGGDDRRGEERPAAGGAASSASVRRIVHRYAFSTGADPRAARAAGWNLIDVDEQAEAERLPAGTRALLWVGDYDNERCDWELADAALREKVRETAGEAKVAGYFFSDEPDPARCPAAPAQHRARSRLIHALDPRALTVMVADANSGDASLRQLRLWRGAADRVGLNPYVCYRGRRCAFGWIDRVIRAADQARLRYWGVVQAFGDDTWRWPTAGELQRMLDRWARSRWSGFMTFAWTWDGDSLAEHPELLTVLRRFNRALARGRDVAGPSASDPGSRASRHPAAAASARGTARQVHYAYDGRGGVVFNWAGSATAIRYGGRTGPMRTVRASVPRPRPISSRGPFREARITGLKPGRTYRYAIGGGPVRSFATVPRGPFRLAFQADVGASSSSRQVATIQAQIAADRPAFVLMGGDLTYGNDEGPSAVDRHFEDVMAWSRSAAYVPAWGNHEWDSSGDDLRNYKGRLAIPNAHASPGAPRLGCCGEDWGWFDAGGVRFISYPEPYADETWVDWRRHAERLMASAQADDRIRLIVTYGHRPAHSTGSHEGEPDLASILGSLGDRFGKYVLNLNGHSHVLERYEPIHGVVHITAGGGGYAVEPAEGEDPRTAFRAVHLGYLRADIRGGSIRVETVCGAASSDDAMTCREGEVIDAVTLAPRR